MTPNRLELAGIILCCVAAVLMVSAAAMVTTWLALMVAGVFVALAGLLAVGIAVRSDQS